MKTRLLNPVLEDAQARVAVAICSTGRPEHLKQTLLWLRRQTNPPVVVLLVVTQPSDLPDISFEFGELSVEIVFSEKGLTRQRNRALTALMHRCDAIFFIDDDFLPDRNAIAALQQIFAQHPDVGGVTGRLLADGITSGGLGFETAKALIRRHEQKDTKVSPKIWDRKRRGLYGCNMAFRVSAIGEARFDEAIPLYGWQEDVDFSNRVDGNNIRIDSLTGVHCGTPSGREKNGALLGYSQIANPLYLMQKGTMSWTHACRLILRNTVANLTQLNRQASGVDRKGRLRGNISAVRDLLTGHLHPMRILRPR